MNPDYEQKLEARIDAELKGLSDLTAPATLAPRVTRALEKRSTRPWYRQSWSTWPRGLQLASFASLALLFAGLCLGTWTLTSGGAGQGNGTFFGDWLRSAGALLKVIDVLENALLSWIRQLGPWVITGGLAALAFAWAACIGLGTVYVRLGMQPVPNRR